MNSWNVARITHEAKLSWSVIIDLHNLVAADGVIPAVADFNRGGSLE